MTDYHSHILPGVDDGVQTTEQALEALAWIESVGIGKVILTPHIMPDYPSNTPEFFRERFDLLRGSYDGPVELSLGAEYMLYASFGEILEGELLPVTDNYLLVETSYMGAPLNFHELLDKIHSRGYHIILAHPERYLYMDSNEYDRLKARGIRFQLNIASLSGAYGNQVRRVAKKLLVKDYYDCLGSDLHSLQYFREILQNTKLPAKILDRLDAIKDGRKL